jgi:DNA-binding PadR family transcriptional regulator
MENVILGLLIIHSLTLYELNAAFKQGISMFYSASYGSLQVAVRNLLKKNLIVFEAKVEQGRNKKIYTITEQGRQAFYQWMLAEVPVNKLEVTALSKVYFLGLIDDNEQRKHIVQEILSKIEQVEGELMGMNAQLSRMDIPPAYQGIFRYQLRTLDYGLNAHRTAREWFEGLLGEVEAG